MGVTKPSYIVHEACYGTIFYIRMGDLPPLPPGIYLFATVSVAAPGLTLLLSLPPPVVSPALNVDQVASFNRGSALGCQSTALKLLEITLFGDSIIYIFLGGAGLDEFGRLPGCSISFRFRQNRPGSLDEFGQSYGEKE